MKLSYQRDKLEAGCDEAGRGCLAGPVVAAAVILNYDFEPGELNDSKKLSSTQRDRLRIRIENEAVCYGVGFVYPDEIDKINILNASFSAMHIALEAMRLTPDFIAVDGNRFNQFKTIPYQCCVKGDANYYNIAAASILAKTYRDAYMHRIHKEFPMYHWDRNKGYPTKIHRNGIRQYGPSPYHRKTFKLLPSQLKLKI